MILSQIACVPNQYRVRSHVMQVDEPLYAHYLNRNPAAFRPYRDKVLAAQNTDGNAVVRRSRHSV